MIDLKLMKTVKFNWLSSHFSRKASKAMLSIGTQRPPAVGRRKYLGSWLSVLMATLALLFIGGKLGDVRAQGQDAFFNEFNTFDPLAPQDGLDNENPIAIDTSFEVAEGTDRGRLKVTARLAPQWHIYSLTQQKGGPTRTTIKVSESAGVSLLGPFVPDQQPHKTISDVWEDLPVEEHSGTVTWSAPIQFVDPAASKSLEIKVALEGLTCRTDGSCVPLAETYPAKFAGTYAAPAASGTYRAKQGVVAWKGALVPGTAAPGEQVNLQLTATPDATFHVYKAVTDDELNSTNFVMTRLAGLRAEAPQASTEPIVDAKGGSADPVAYHEGEVTWTVPLTIPADAAAGEYEIGGALVYQACTDSSCRMPQAFEFSGTLQIGSAISDQSGPLAFEKASYGKVLELAGETKWVSNPNGEESKNASKLQGGSGNQESSLGVILGMALIGGLILNLMPCVLPVVGLKLMALVDTAGDDQRKIFSHNMWYSFGLLSVFWLLAGIAIAVKVASGDSFSWGQQFTYWQFRLGLTLLVFAMALSFLGVWEIPLPGFASGKASQQLQKKEGPAGAFFKGIFTTLLATPCSGPLLGAVFGFTLAASPVVTWLIFTTVGLGMALPYIIIGLMPHLVYWLPKPGPWMETLKQLMAFVLLGTVAFLFAGFSDHYRVFVFVTLIGTWFGCWWIGQVPNWKPLHQRFTAWTGGITTALLVGFLAFRLLIPGAEKMPWEPYSEQRLAQLQAEGRTVMVDFTAKWCVNCIVNYNRALNTEETAEMLDELDAVPMLADWTDHNDEIRDKLSELNSNSIPVLAIYPAGRPNDPIVLRDLVNQQEVLEALQQAGPSAKGSVAKR